MYRILRIASVALIFLGVLWALQGAGYVGGSFMSGASEWLYIGIATAIAGVIGLFVGSRAA